MGGISSLGRVYVAGGSGQGFAGRMGERVVRWKGEGSGCWLLVVGLPVGGADVVGGSGGWMGARVVRLKGKQSVKLWRGFVWSHGGLAVTFCSGRMSGSWMGERVVRAKVEQSVEWRRGFVLSVCGLDEAGGSGGDGYGWMGSGVARLKGERLV